MQLIVKATGSVHCLYGEELDLPRLGRLAISRGSHVEPTSDGQWTANGRPTWHRCMGLYWGRFLVARTH
jgi:hypothetical protein